MESKKKKETRTVFHGNETEKKYFKMEMTNETREHILKKRKRNRNSRKMNTESFLIHGLACKM